jgi:hypothetical protein
MYFFFGIAGNPPTRIFNQSSASSKSVHQFHGGELLDLWQPKAQKWAISISSLEAKPKRSPAAQWQHIQNQGHGRMRLILN